ncbi:tetratricopeptide repeat protein [Undibacterium sp. TJN19]|uniref:tetratricopeptide repeat protein n=1 Tax=Undibacterium sp. TJN19 TaxID=3413055 RepID=UPI003BF337EC
MSSSSAPEITTMLQQAVTLHQQGQLQAAGDLYQQVLTRQPDHFDALQLLGVIARQGGDAPSALKYLNAAIAVNPAQAIAHCNLGATLQDLGRSAEALASYDRALQLNPAYLLALNNRGNVLRSLGRLEESLQNYQHALQLKPDYAEALLNRGISLQAMDQHEAALADFDAAMQLKKNNIDACFARAVSLQHLQYVEEAIQDYDDVIHQQPHHAEAWCNRGICLQKLQHYEEALTSYGNALKIRPVYAKAQQQLGRVLQLLARDDEAIAAYGQALAQGADAEQINYALATLGKVAAPVASPAAYVTELFDQYAGHFDQHLLTVLDYQVPVLLVAALERQGPPQRSNSLDLGCGTGLCARFLRPWSTRLTGVDLSARMLEKARQTELYDDLHQMEIAAFLQQSSQHYDVIVAADVFVYIGDLHAVFAGVKKALCKGALFGFSCEVSSTADYLLQPSHRYAHSLPYLQALADAHDFVLLEASQAYARQDKGEKIRINIIVMQRK